jgi:hypothetical protein
MRYAESRVSRRDLIRAALAAGPLACLGCGGEGEGTLKAPPKAEPPKANAKGVVQPTGPDQAPRRGRMRAAGKS